MTRLLPAISASLMLVLSGQRAAGQSAATPGTRPSVEVRRAAAHDRSAPLRSPRTRQASLAGGGATKGSSAGKHTEARAVDVEQKAQGNRASATIAASFDGLGVGFVGPQGSATMRN